MTEQETTRRWLLDRIEGAAPIDVEPRQRGLYVLLRESQIVYVGQSQDVHQRIITHAREGVKIFNQYKIFTPVYCDNMDTKEAILIMALGFPEYNQTLPHNPYWGSIYTIASEHNVYPSKVIAFITEHGIEDVEQTGYYAKMGFERMTE